MNFEYEEPLPYIEVRQEFNAYILQLFGGCEGHDEITIIFDKNELIQLQEEIKKVIKNERNNKQNLS